jgi:hypothetical protein
MRPSLRNRHLFDEHRRIDLNDPDAQRLPIANIVYDTEDPDKKWLAEATGKIGDWRSVVRSVYLRWAITINAMHVARDKYAGRPDIALTTSTLRARKGGQVDSVNLAIWDSPTTVDNYERASSLMAAYGVEDLYGAIEEIVFDLYEVFLKHNPQPFIEGRENRPLRALYKQRGLSEESQAAYDAAWLIRFEAWRRKKAYMGLKQIFAALTQATGMTAPRGYVTTPADWGSSIELIGEVRNLVAHGAGVVSMDLQRFCEANPAFGFRFTAGHEFVIELRHLMLVENFTDSLLTALNLSLMQLATGKPFPPQAG